MLKTNVRPSLIRVSRVAVAVASVVVFGAACEGGEGEGEGEGAGEEIPANTTVAVSNYSEIVLASYEDSLAAAIDLDSAIAALTTLPSAATLETAREAWLAAREPYLQTEVYRFYDGPIDNTDDGPEGLINAWPLDENYIDYVTGDAEAGFVNDTDFVINEENVRGANELEGEKNISTGYHAIEFLLWGQDLSTTGPGDRPFADYLTIGGTTNADRRANYLELTSTLLLADLQFLVDSWAEDDATNYRAEFEGSEATTPGDGLRRILTGMIILSGFETGGERLQAALDGGDQEDEHSCFSDNTHRDMIQDIQGVQNVWLGTYGTVAGVGIKDVINVADPALATRITTEIDTALTLAHALVPPFDQELVTPAGQARIRALIAALRTDLAGSLEEAFRLFGLQIPADPA